MTDWTSERWAEASRLLDAVLDLPATQRTAYLMEHVADAALRAEIEALMAAEDEVPGFLEDEAAAFAWPLLPDLPSELQAAQVAQQEARDEAAAQSERLLGEQHVGPYRLVRVLGQGGMGTVYLAHRDDGQFHQQVAIKLVRGGALARSEDALRRFRQERQILADLRHPGIAALVGGGLAEPSASEPFGLPYLALDYVDGTPITAYCDAHGLDVRARLGLLAEVCEAVRYAHQNLVVHRDLKPGNILVEEDADGKPRARLLDFGVAKLLDTAAEADDAPTRPETRRAAPHTPAYAAPEQLRGEPATTATDVYALGVLLGELLTGSRPEPADSDGTELSAARLAALVTPEAAAARGTTPEALRRTLGGDLTALVQTALADDPTRRYASADALLADVRAYLGGLPLAARPPRASYRVGKFMRRHRGVVAAGGLALAALLIGLGTALWQADRARAERDRARAEAEKSDAVTEFFVDLLRAEDPRQARGDTVTVRQVLASGADRIEGDLAGQPEVQARLLLTMGALYRSLGDYDRADSLLTRSLAVQHTLPPDVRRLAPAASELAQLHFERIQLAAADSFMQIAVAELEARGDATPTDRADAFGMLGEIRREQRDFDAANDYYARTIALLEAAEEPDGERIATTYNNMALVHAGQGRFVAAAPLLRRAVETLEAAEGRDHPWIATMRYNLAHMLNEVGRYPEAEGIFAEIVEAERATIGSAHPRFASSLAGKALVKMNRAQFAEADSLLSESIRILTDALGPEDRQTLFRRYQRAIGMHQAGQFGEALEEVDDLVAVAGRIYPDPARRSVGTLTLRGDVLHALGRYGEAYDAYAAARDGLATQRGEGHPSTARLTLFMALARLGAGAHAEAEALAREAYHLRRDSTGPDAFATAVMRRGYADVLADLGRLSEAEAHRVAADSVFVEKEGPESFEHLEALQLGARIALAGGRAEDAAGLAQASLAALQRTRTDAHPQTAESHCLLAEALLAQGDAQAARRHADAARPVVQQRGSAALRERCKAALGTR